jgi:hypothetical protein
MNIGSLTTEANLLADEDFSSSQVFSFLNSAIARINIEREANFPYYDLNQSDVEYPGFPEKWQRTLLIPFVVGRIKAVDASQFEYTDQYNEFMTNLALFKLKFPVPADYKDANESTSFEPDFTGSYWGWDGSGSSNGSDPLS